MSKLLNCLSNKTIQISSLVHETSRQIFARIRNEHKTQIFLKLCLNSKLAEITLQPMKRFNLDAAIVFRHLSCTLCLRSQIKFGEKGPIEL